MPKLGKAYPGREGPPTVCRCGNEPDSNESQHAASPVRRAVGDQRRGSATSGESVNATSVTRVEEPMDVDLSNEESQDTNRQKRKSHNDAPAKDSHLQDMANSLEPPVCHGTSPDQPCNTPITTEHFCESCGQKNKYIQCLGSRKDDASPCKTFVEPGHSCPCCGQHAKPTTASAVVEKKQITEMSVNLRPCYQKNVKESELRGKPTAQHDVENHGKIDSINSPRKNERDCTHLVGKDRATNLGKTDSKNNLGKNDSTTDAEKNDSTKSLDEDCPQTEDISTLEVASGGASGSDNFGAMTHPASKKVFGEPIANGSKMFKNRSLSGENKTEVDGGDASATTAEEQKNQRSESACQSQTTKETGDADQSKTNTEAAKGESDSLESKDPHEISKEDGTTNCAEPSDPKTGHELGDEGEDAKNGNQESQGAGAGHENESGGKPYRKGQEKNLVEGTKTTRGNKKERKKGKNKENTTVHTSQHLQTKGKTQGKRQVRFHVALHKDFHYNHANDSVCIRFHHPHLGGFAESKHRMEKVKDFSEGYVLFELTVVMPDSITCRLQYKYVFFHQTDKNAEPNFLYEWIPGFNKKEQPSHNRILDMTKLQKDVLHQYDGLMHPPAEGISWWEKLKKTFTGTSHKEHKEHMDEVKEVTLAMLPRWHYFYCETREDQELIAANAEEVVERISSVYRYMESSFKNEDQQTKSNKWKEILWQYLKPWKDHTRTQLAGKHPTKEEAKIHLVSALSVVDLICKFDGHILADLADLDLVLDCLLLRPDENGDIRHVIECVREHFKNPMKSLLGPLQSIIKFLVNKVAEAHIAQKWLYIVPLIHLLMEDSCQQYCDEHQTAQWWGVCLFNEQQEKFKRNMEFGSELQLDFLVEQLCPLFGVDPLLPRTLMTTLSWKHLLDAIPLPCFPPDACIALCYHFIKVKDFILYREDQQVIEKCFELVVDKIEGLQSEPVDVVLDSHDERIMKSDILLNISMNLLELLIKETSVGCRWYQERIMVADAAGVLAASMKYCSHLRKLLSVQDQEFSLRFRSTLTVARDRIVNWLSLVLPRRIKMHNRSFFDDHLEPQIFSRLLYIRFGFDDADQFWSQGLMEALLRRINEVSQEERIEIFCGAEDFSKYHKDIESCFSEEAFKVLNDVNIFNIRHDPSSASHNKYQYVVSKKFKAAWKKSVGESKDRIKILLHLLTWSSSAGYLEIHYNGKAVSVLDEECKPKIALAASLLADLYDRLKSHDINVDDFGMILEHKESFISLCSVLVMGRSRPEERTTLDEAKKKAERNDLIAFVNMRKYELDYYQEICQKLQGFIDACNSITCVEVGPLGMTIQRDLGNVTIRELVAPIPHQHDYEGGPPLPEIVVFPVLPAVIKALDEIKVLKSSNILKGIWNRIGELKTKEVASGDTESLDLEEAIEEIWTPARKEWHRVTQSLKAGNATLQDIDKYFGFFEGNVSRIEKELLAMKTFDDSGLDVPAVLEKIELYYKLECFASGARAILEVKDEFGLTGDFETIEMLANVERNKNQSLKRMDKSILQTGQLLEKITLEQIGCLHVIGECNELIKWLKEEIGETKHLKVFVDLASISAGEGDYNMDRVHMLHSVITGYAPLISDLPQNANAETFLNHCEMVWGALKSDPTLPMKLRSIQGLMDWLKLVKDSRGSVEVSSLGEADDINARGIYRVGNLNRGHKKVEDVIQLTVPSEKKGEDAKKYSFEQLNELQSKLMLVSTSKRDGDDDISKHAVDRFTEIFEGIATLARAYVKTCLAGNVLFQDWVSTFFCDPSRKVNVQVNIQLEESILTDRNKGEITEQIHNLATFMVDCLNEWRGHLCEQRSIFPQLNHFTTAQIVTLRGEFAKVRNKEQLDVMTYDMLHNIKHDCRHEDLIAAVGFAENMIREHAAPVKKSPEPDEDAEDVPADIREVLEKITDGDVSKKLARLAIKECGLDVDKCQLWCWENQDKDDGVDNETDKGSQSSDDEADDLLGDLNLFQPSVRDVTFNLLGALDKSKKGLCDQLRELWDGFLTSVSTSVKDYLSVEHLGMILDALSDRENTVIKRSFPRVLKQGRPNLIVCPEVDVYNTTLSLYMGDKPEDVQLPSDDEVLLCTAQTTAEEVELLWQRAVKDQQMKIFCLVNADLLDYDVSDQVEKSLDNYIKGRTDFRLVIICSTEREDTSRIVTALDRDRRPLIPCSSEKVMAYLHQQFQKDLKSCRGKSAAGVEFEKLSVRLVKSSRAGVGKSLLIKKRSEALGGQAITVRLHERHMTDSDLVEKLLGKRGNTKKRMKPTLFHIDIGHDVVEGVDHVLFNMLILRCVKDAAGRCWRRHPSDLYMIENLPLLRQEMQRTTGNEKVQYVHQMLNILPSVTCHPPKKTLSILRNEVKLEGSLGHVSLIYDDICRSKEFTRPYHQLKTLTPGERKPCPPFLWLELLLDYCGVENGDPSWSELHNFASFLNTQLADAERSAFCSDSVQADLPGFAVFVVKFMVQMSKDFATRSLMVSEETPQLLQPQVGEDDDEHDDGEDEDDGLLALRRRWETSPHPYIFFNPDGHSFTFLGFNIDRKTGNLIDNQTRQILNTNIMSTQLFDALSRNEVRLAEDFDSLGRGEKIIRLCTVMGLEDIYDPDETYELTTDNVKKMLAIYMRFRCGIPVVVMGETGCGKTRLIKFMCDLQVPPSGDVKNMVLMKVHGGTTHADIITKVEEAQRLAVKNRKNYPKMHTILFFDEANTTEAIGLIKEIMCDNSMNGEQIDTNTGLKFVAACNPYRKHTKEMIQNLEQAGLGYNVKSDKTADKLGRVPMRHLVYRVQPLPQSMLPLVWDFGQLNDEVEKMYIRQIVQRYMDDEQIPDETDMNRVITNILAASQRFMRAQKDECSFVSLRDVERTMNVMAWFYEHIELLNERMDDSDEEDEDTVDDETRSLILALGVCYHACLQEGTRRAYREYIVEYFEDPCALPRPSCVLEEINRCQDLFLKEAQITEPNIAHNQALKENLFMMVVCIELRIPLFLVGKPGSSKSLAKLIVTDAMQGETADSPLFKSLKQVHMVSFQCSPLATPDGIKGTFSQCAMFQEKKNLEQFVSVVVLDEVGLAEDSPRMPLKTLHPLLEDGTCSSNEKPEAHKKVAFIGISNWALDPAKMNRGILVQRGVPDEEELIRSAEGICRTKREVFENIRPLIPRMAKAYLELYDSAQEIREFFGLRDFYSLVKMVYAFAEKSRAEPTWHQLEHAVRRNFGGIENVDPVEVFRKKFPNMSRHRKLDDPECDAKGLIKACLSGDGETSESRYLLILTENYAALGILKQHLLNMEDFIVIFGSSFRSDQEYTQVCRNINRIKKCMETGKTVVLLNLESLYESLYDALNQYYVHMGGERYVDLGLGTHRVKCRVHKSFRLIVVAEKEVVYKEFPIPLINRLEKHVLSMTTMLTEKQIMVMRRVGKWAKDYVTPKLPLQMHQPRRKAKPPTPGDVFCGYHDDTAASVVLQVSKEMEAEETGADWNKEVFTQCKEVLLMCATPESVVRLKDTKLDSEGKALFDRYFIQQAHDSLPQLLKWMLEGRTSREGVFLEVTTKSHLLAKKDAKALSKSMGIGNNFTLLALQAMDTKQQFSRELGKFFNQENDERLMLLQCDSGDRNSNLIACARYQIMEEFTKSKSRIRGKAHFVFIVQMPRVMAGSFIGFQGGRWRSVYLDDLRIGQQLAVIKLSEKSIGDLIEESVKTNFAVKGIGQCLQQKGALGFIDDVHISREGPLTPPLSPESVEIHVEDIDIENSETGPIQLREVVPMTRQRVQEHEGCQTHDARCNRSVDQLLDVDALIHSCVQSSTSMVKDPETVPSKRATKRLHIILAELSQKEDVISLMDVTKLRMLQLFQEKEGKMSVVSLARDWLRKDAAAAETINRVGTFRRAVQIVIENKLTPILAGLVAYMDTNCNLDILKKKETHHHDVIRQLWLQMFADQLVTQLSYAHFQSPTTHVEMTEMISPQTGIGHHLFKPLFPFSWEVHSQMELIIQTSRTAAGEKMELTCERLFLDSSVGKFLNRFLQDQPETVQNELMEHYLKDFVHMCFKLDGEELEQILMKTLKIAFREIRLSLKLDEEDGTRLTIPKLHLTYAKCRERLEHFFHACSVWPQCLESLKDNKEHELSSTVTEMTLDVNVLVLMIDFINDLQDKLKKVKGRKAWLEQVKTLKPVIERIMQQNSVHDSRSPLGALCQKYMEEYKPLWTRICVVQLFIDHVCPPHVKDEAARVDSMGPLWLYLGNNSNFKSAASVEKVAQFLKTCKNKYVTKFYKDHLKCPGCQEVKNDPVQLPCKHSLCRDCLQEQFEVDDRICLTCKAEIPEAFSIPVRASNRDADIAYKKYINASNQFFMDIISQLCFAEDLPPQQDVIKILISYVIHEPRDPDSSIPSSTKQFTVYDECIDATPVLRSLLLQLLLRYNTDDVREHLQLYFNKSRQFLKNQEHVIELSLLCARCFEDSYHSHCSSESRGDVLEERIRMGTEHLESACDHLVTEVLDITKVEAIAKTRFGLAVAAEMMYRIHVVEEDGHDRVAVQRLWEVARRVHSNSQSKWPRLYLVKQLCRTYGMDCLSTISRVHYLEWILPDEAKYNQNAAVDRLVLYGNHYKRLRDCVVKVTLGEPLQDFAAACEGLKGKNQVKEVACLLALHREVFTQNMFEENVNHRICDEIIDNLLNVCIRQKFMKNQQAARDILEGAKSERLGPHPVHADNTTKAIKDLLVLFNLVMQSSNKSPALLKPLKTMMSEPRKMVASYLPTMPQDHLEEVREAILKNRRDYENPVFYACSNGHPYIIGDCGRPSVRDTCRTCGVTIGGIEHVAVVGNEVLGTRDDTQTGHVLGRADMQDLTPVPERNLSPAVTIILRLLLHMSMQIGTNHDDQAIAVMIKPNVAVKDVRGFLFDHIRHDIQLLARALGKSPDDCLSIMTLLVSGGLMEEKRSDARFNLELKSKDARRNWEIAFSQAYLTPLLQELDVKVNRINKRLLDDERLSHNPLIKIIHEVITLGDDVDINQIHNSHLMWQYRYRVTVDHLAQLMNDNAHDGDQTKILRHFLQEEHHLRAMCHLPAIIKLQQILLQKYQYRINQTDARLRKVSKFLQEDVGETQRMEIKGLVDEFAEAWKCVRDTLQTYSASGYTLPRENCDITVNEDTPIAMLIPSQQGLGLCSVMLVEFLTRKHNEFIMAYCRYKERESSELPEFSIKEATPAHLISYDPEKDLLPMVLANCNYSLEVGKGTIITYDFSGIERQLEERLLRGKPKLRFEISSIVFRGDYSNAAEFHALRSKIRQEPMSHAIRMQIVQECRIHYHGLPDSMAHLDVAIHFLLSVGGDPETKLITFMCDTLKLPEKIFTSQIRQHCLLMHIQSLWLILSMERSRQMHCYDLDPFDTVSQHYHEPLDADAIHSLYNALQHLNIDTFVSELHECILLNINVQQSRNEGDAVDNANFGLADVMREYINSKDGTAIPSLSNGTFPREILVMHAVSVWTEAVTIQNKEEMTRRH